MNDLKDKHIQLGMKASGNWIDELEVQTTELSGTLLGAPYTEQLEDGRKKGGRPPIEAIKKWIVEKGIVNSIRGSVSVTSLAFAIATKIGKEGWKRKDHGGVELVSQIVTPQRMQSIINKIGQNEVFIFTERLSKELKLIKA